MNRIIDFEILYDIIGSASKEAESFTLAIDGGSASGKSTLAEKILRDFDDVTVFHMDDFYLRPEQRTDARYAEAGGNVDRERFFQEVLYPLSKNAREILYRPLDCKTFTIAEGSVIHPGKIRIIEGAYSHHPELRELYDIRVFLDIDSQLQKQRIITRNTPYEQEMFFSRWIPFENKYFEAFNIKEQSDYVIELK